jgi:hypothetical protein
MQEADRTPSPSPQARAPYNPAAAVLYGQFVMAVYTMYDSDPSNLTPPPSSDFPRGYELAAWVQMQDFIFESTGPTFYGIIAQSTSDLSQFILAIRGTSTWVEWWDDLNSIRLAPFKDPGFGLVGAGFARIYETLEVIPVGAATEYAAPQSLKSLGGFSQQVSALVNRRAGSMRTEAQAPSASIAVAAHSLGAALATLYVLDNASSDRARNPLIYTFASPRVGNLTFANGFNALGLTSWRIDNLPDIVPYLPLGFTHVDTLQQYDSLLTVWPSPGCWHSLATYLSLIDSNLQPDPDCQWLALPEAAAIASAVEAAPARPAAAPAAGTVTVPAGPVTVNITVNVGGKG